MNFAQPGWLALLLLLPLLGVGAVMASRLRRRQWAEFVAPRLRQALLKRGSSLPRWLALFFMLTACAAIILALARPRGDAGTRTEKTLGRNVMIALDISKSMRVSDVKPDRLSQAKVVIYELLEAMPSERIGLIGFAGNPYVFAPLTIDHSAVRETVEQIDENWAPLGGSDLAAAVELATETLKKTGQKNNALVILSDGEKHDGDLDAMIAEAERAGIYIIAIGVGTEEGGSVPDPSPVDPGAQMLDSSGRPVLSRLQPEVMRQLAEETKGRFTVAGSGLDIPAIVKSVVKDLDTFEMDGRERKISIEFYQWLMFPAILFLIVSIVSGTRWKGIQTALLVAGAFLTISQADASEASTAKNLLEAENFQEARESYRRLAGETQNREKQARYRLGEATAAYRGEDFRNARTAYSQALLSTDSEVQANSHLGMGNSLFQLGWKGLSGEFYPRDAESLPDLDRFDTIVKEALAKLRESETPEDSEAGGFVQMEALITNWADAVRHYQSALAIQPDNKIARQNRTMTLTYLSRLAELLKQEEEETQQSMPQPQPGEGPPQEGEGEEGEGEPQEGEGKGNKQPGQKGEGEEEDEEPQEGDGGEEDKEGKKGEDGEEQDGDKSGENPNESPEDRAHRILEENSDRELGPLSPGRREFRDAKQDW